MMLAVIKFAFQCSATFIGIMLCWGVLVSIGVALLMVAEGMY